MPLRSKPFYWIECDHPGCTARAPDKHDEFIAWADESTAEVMADEADWMLGRKGNDFPYLCPDHKIQHCEDCTALIGPLAGEQDYLCDACTPASTGRP